MRELLVSLLVVNAMFLCLLPHSIHCDFIKNITKRDCPPHIVLLVFGLSSFILAVLVAQKEYIEDISNIVKQTTQVGGVVLSRLSKIGKKALSKLPSPSQVADRVENFVDKSSKL